MMRLLTVDGTIGTDYEHAFGVGIAGSSAGVSQVVTQALSMLVDERVLVVDAAQHVYSSGLRWDGKTVAVFERQRRESTHVGIGWFKFKDDTACSLRLL